jgi:hypothetical protein
MLKLLLRTKRMHMTAKRRSQPWWVILLLMPMMMACAFPVVVWEVALYLGATLAYTGTGQFIEQVVDNLVDRIFHESSAGYVIQDRGNPLEGTYSGKMKFATESPEGQRRTYELNKPRMYRDSETSIWRLAPDMRDLVNQVLKGGA